MKQSLLSKTQFFFAIGLCLTTTRLLYSDPQEGYVPLYAGTQLAFYPDNAAPGHIGVQPYFVYINRYGQYNEYWSKKSLKNIESFSSLLILETGITNWLDISLDLTGAYRRSGNESSWMFGDTSLYLGIQPLHDQKNTWTPDLRILLGETFPTGKYDHLNPHKRGSDIFGTGSYITTLLLVIAKTFYNLPSPYNINLNLYYIQPSSVPVHGLSLYGGSSSTRGRAFPQSGFITNLGLQYSLTQFWALGVDMRYVHQNKTTIKTNQGKLSLPSYEQFSLAPCLEYSWSEDFSTAIGPWFTIAGRNSQAFFGFLSNVYVYF